MLLAAACSTDPAPPETRSEAIGSQVSLKVEGRADAQLDGPLQLRIATLQGKGYEEIALLSVGLEEPSPIGDGRMIRAAIDIVGYSGDGDYLIGGPAAEDDLPVRSAFFVEIFRPGSAEGYARFDDALEPCNVTVRDEGGSGELKCESLSGSEGTVKVGMTWQPSS
ncbi:MAG: hypothetical protein ACLGH3_10155 [Actinomycetota bacterium]